MTVGQVFSVFSLLCNRYPLPDINSCYRYRVFDFRNDYTWRYRCCPEGYVFEKCKCRQAMSGFVYDPARRVYTTEGLFKSNGFPRIFRKLNTANSLNERRLKIRPVRIVKYVFPGTHSIRRLSSRPIIRVPSRFFRSRRITTPLIRKTHFRRNSYPREIFTRKIISHENIPSIDLQGVSKADQFQIHNADVNALSDSSLEASTDWKNIFDPVKSAFKQRDKSNTLHKKGNVKFNSQDVLHSSGMSVDSGTNEILIDGKTAHRFLDTSIGIDDTITTTKKPEFIFDQMKYGNGKSSNGQYIFDTNELNNFYLQPEVSNAFSAKEVLGNMRLNLENFVSNMKQNNQVAEETLDTNEQSKLDTSLLSSEMPSTTSSDKKQTPSKKKGNITKESPTDIRTETKQESKTIESLSVPLNENDKSAFIKTDKVVTIKEEDMNGKNNLPGNDTIVELAGNGNGASNYPVGKDNGTVESSDITIDEHSYPKENLEKGKTIESIVKSEDHQGESKQSVGGPSMTINLDSNTTMTIPFGMDGSEGMSVGALLQDALKKSTVENIKTSKDKSDSFTVINVPVESHENSIVKGITFKVPTKVGKFFKILSNKDSIHA